MHDFGFFSLECVVYLLGVFSSELVNEFFGALLGIFWEFCGLDVLTGIFADVAKGDFSLFYFGGGSLDDLFAALFSEGRNRDTDYAAVVRGVKA